ncbi:ABC transporter ATP-binding protein, partial [Caldicellulosiruptoraceae bacterium PP1]
MGVVLELENVKKNYGKKEAVRDISFIIKEGEIVGFIGPNGAGKSTTIKMIVGLIRATSGNIKVFGYNIEENRIEALKNIGCIVENPELYEYMSGWDNILQFARIFGIKDTEKLKEIVDFVGLKDAINRKVKTYSLGMKQRLALAVSLVSSPKLLILDEPTNGLDPSGIIEFRNLLKKLA